MPGSLPAKFTTRTPKALVPHVSKIRVRRDLPGDVLAQSLEQLSQALVDFNSGTILSLAKLVDAVQACQDSIDAIVDHLTP